MRTRVLLLMVALWRPAPAEAQQTEYFEPTPPKARFTLRWEALLRYDSIYHLRVRPDIERGRFEFRPEVASHVHRGRVLRPAAGRRPVEDHGRPGRVAGRGLESLRRRSRRGVLEFRPRALEVALRPAEQSRAVRRRSAIRKRISPRRSSP